DALVVSVKRSAAGKPVGPWAALDPFLTASLPTPALASTAPPAAGPPLAEEARTARETRAARLAGAAAPTYGALSVTSLSHAAAPKPEWVATGRGMAFGRVLHGALEALMRDPNIDLAVHAANLL